MITEGLFLNVPTKRGCIQLLVMGTAEFEDLELFNDLFGLTYRHFKKKSENQIEAKIYDIVCGQCGGKMFKAVDEKYKCQDCGYALTDDDIERILKQAAANELTT